MLQVLTPGVKASGGGGERSGEEEGGREEKGKGRTIPVLQSGRGLHGRWKGKKETCVPSLRVRTVFSFPFRPEVLGQLLRVPLRTHPK